jgi:hypothetical protein
MSKYDNTEPIVNQKTLTSNYVEQEIQSENRGKYLVPHEVPIETPNEIYSQLEIRDIDEKKRKHVPFWFENPNILLNPQYLYEFFPNETMTYEQKLNSISRVVILLTLLGFLFTQKLRILIIGGFTLLAIFILYHSQKKKKQEGYENPVTDVLREKNIKVPADVFDEPTPQNPFSNVMIPDYVYNVNKKPAPPASNENVSEQILKQAKQMVIEQNATQPDIADKLFKNLGDEWEFEQSMRQFVTQPGSTIPNDQNAFSLFCYGSMISAKEGNLFAAARNKSNYNLY